ncbi:MAG: PAS domain-containing protein [Ferrovibrio sp.]
MCTGQVEIPVTCARCAPDARRNCRAGLLRLFAYWDRLRRGRAMPARADVDPLDLPVDLLPHVFLIDVLSGAPYFRYRLTGTMVDEIHGQYLTGKAPRDIRTPEIAMAAESQCRRVLMTHSPSCDHVTLMADDRSFWHFERLALPLSDDGGGTVNMLLSGIYIT